jgi:hypothetical protein
MDLGFSNHESDRIPKRLMKPILLAVCFLALAYGPASSAFGQGTAFTYQGSLTDSGSPANGNYDMEFYLRDAASGGNPVGTTNTLAPVAVSNGLFTVTLDFGAGIFDGSSRWLEIGVRTNGSLTAYTTLSPRQALTPSPYAIFAALAGGVANGAITSAMLANGSVTSNKVANDAIGTAQLGSNVVTSGNIAAGAVGTLQISNNAITGQQLANTVALGGTNAFGRLDIYRTPSNTPAISLNGSTTQLRMFGPDAQEKVSLDALPGWGQLTLHNNSFISQQAAVLTANAMGGGSLLLNNSNGLTRALIFGGDNGGLVQLFQPSGTNTVTLFGNGSRISTYGNDGLERIRLWGPAYGEVLLNNDLPGNQTAVRLTANGSSGGALYLNDTNGLTRAALAGYNGGGSLNLYRSDGAATVTLAADDGAGSGFVYGVHAAATGTAAGVQGTTASADPSANAVYGLVSSTTPGASSAGVRGQNNGTGLFGIGVYGSQAGSGWGVYGTTPSGIGVRGDSSTGTGVYASSSSGSGVYAYSSTGPALTIGNGAIQVSGAGIGTSTAAFIHVATTNNSYNDVNPNPLAARYITTITNRLCDGNPNAILILTHNTSPAGANGGNETHPYGVWYNQGHWTIYHEDVTSIVGEAFNVLAVTP